MWSLRQGGTASRVILRCQWYEPESDRISTIVADRRGQTQAPALLGRGFPRRRKKGRQQSKPWGCLPGASD